MTPDEILDRVLIPRPNGSEGLERVAAFIAASLERAGAEVSLQPFSATPHGFQLVWNFIVFPVFLLSGALLPLDVFPNWLRYLSYLNPLTYGVDGLRGSLVGISDFSLVLAFGLGAFYWLPGFAESK